ncbi:DMT family transporter [Leptospira fletcheri]|uniref:DMT family transporter n=1 Tax=Leptospira fletcheri TaxID=2484981 RepID=A0A4R9GDU6_9LEPT|nr:DMT family transporter [Leptospira fletcheri]
MNPNATAPVRFFVLLVISMVSWGFAWPSAKVIVGTLHPNVIIFWRFLATALSVVPVLLWKKESLRLPDKRTTLLVFVGAILYTIYNQFFLLGLSSGFAGAGGVLVTTINPIFTYLLVHLVQKQIPNGKDFFGLALGLVGGLVLLRIWEKSSEGILQSGNIFFLLCAFSWAFLSLNSHSAGQKISPLVYSFYVFAIGAVFDFLLAIPYGIERAFLKGWEFWSQILYLSVVSTTFGTTVYFYAASRLGSRIASSFIFLVPVTAVLGSWIFLGEIPNLATLTGGTLAILAVLILNRTKKEKILTD